MLPPLLPSHFVYKRELGKGGFARVVEARDIRVGGPKSTVAIKMIPAAVLRSTPYGKYVIQEVCIHGAARSRNVVRVREVYETADHIGVVMDRMKGGDLLQYANRNFFEKGRTMPEYLARWFFQQLIFAVRHIHEDLKASHRDIKLENILLDEPDELDPNSQFPTAFLSDFGFAQFNDVEAKSIVGTFAYLAPEVRHQVKERTGYDGRMADVYSCGVCLHAMIFAEFPDRSRDIQTSMRANRKTKPSEGCLSLLGRLLEPDPRVRIKLRDIWSHPWFRTDCIVD